MVLKPPFRYIGSKWVLAKKIVEYLRPNKVYIEPFAGMVCVLLRKNKRDHTVECINDINEFLISFWKVMASGRYKQLANQFVNTPWSRTVFREYVDYLSYRKKCDADEFTKALIFLYVHCYAYSGIVTHAGMPLLINSRLNRREFSIKRIQESFEDLYMRIKDVMIENKDAIELMRYRNKPHTTWYIDPPYLGLNADLYTHHGGEDWHKKLLQSLANIRGCCVVSHYRHHLYDALLDEGWCRIDIPINKRAGVKAGSTAPIVTESLYINRNTVEWLKDEKPHLLPSGDK